MIKINDTKHYSSCCGVVMPDYPADDRCPKCKEHTDGLTEDEMEAEEKR